MKENKNSTMCDPVSCSDEMFSMQQMLGTSADIYIQWQNW